MKNTLHKLETKRAALAERIAATDAAIRAERQKLKQAERRDALAILHKSGVLDDPVRLRALLQKAVPGDSRNEAQPIPAGPAFDVPATTGAGVSGAL